MTGYVAKKYGLEVIWFPADWEKYGRAAGPIRNKQMIMEGKPDLVVAFHNNISKSRGTKNMVTQARRHGIRVQMMLNCSFCGELLLEHKEAKSMKNKVYLCKKCYVKENKK